MAKTKARKKAARKRPDDLAIAVALERAKLKRLVQGKRDIARLVNELRRATLRSDVALVDLARDIAERSGEEQIDDKLPAGEPRLAGTGT